MSTSFRLGVLTNVLYSPDQCLIKAAKKVPSRRLIIRSARLAVVPAKTASLNGAGRKVPEVLRTRLDLVDCMICFRQLGFALVAILRVFCVPVTVQRRLGDDIHDDEI